VRCGQREWEEFYRRRWQYDKRVRSTHGVNCTGSCSWDVYVKNGIIVWGDPAHGLPRLRRRLSQPRAAGMPARRDLFLVHLQPGAPEAPADALDPARTLARGPGRATRPGGRLAQHRRGRGQTQILPGERGKGGFVRVSWDEAATLVAASLIHTIQTHGPDRIFRFHADPGHVHGLLRLRGALPVADRRGAGQLLRLVLRPAAGLAPDVGRADDVPESADWYESFYMIVWGTNLPMTRTPDAHFFTEARYRGARVAAVAPGLRRVCQVRGHLAAGKAGTDAASPWP